MTMCITEYMYSHIASHDLKYPTLFGFHCICQISFHNKQADLCGIKYENRAIPIRFLYVEKHFFKVGICPALVISCKQIGDVM